MAQKVHVVLVDDIDHGDADETVSFGLDGATYEIDLSAANASALRDAMASYVGHARKVTAAGRATRTRGGTARTVNDTARIRDWARAQGIAVSDRGRIKSSIRDQYYAAH